MKRLWFKAKNYGYGWYPYSWEGWVVTGVYTLLVLIVFRLIDLNSDSVGDTLLRVIAPFIVLTLIFILFCIKTGEKARWRWGNN